MEDEDEAVKIALAKSVLFTIQEQEDCQIVQTISRRRRLPNSSDYFYLFLISFHFIWFIFIFIIFIIFIICLFLFIFLFLLFFVSSQLAARSFQLFNSPHPCCTLAAKIQSTFYEHNQLFYGIQPWVFHFLSNVNIHVKSHFAISQANQNHLLQDFVSFSACWEKLKQIAHRHQLCYFC